MEIPIKAVFTHFRDYATFFNDAYSFTRHNYTLLKFRIDVLLVHMTRPGFL